MQAMVEPEQVESKPRRECLRRFCEEDFYPPFLEMWIFGRVFVQHDFDIVSRS